MGRICNICDQDISKRYKTTKYCSSSCAKIAKALKMRVWRKTHGQTISDTYYGSLCRECNTVLSVINTYINRAKTNDKICKICSKKRSSRNTTKYYMKYRKIILEKLGNKCVTCGFSNKKALQLDHIHGDGHVERKLKIWYGAYLKRLAEMPLEDLKKTYQLLCANCNWIKRVDNKEHRRNRE